MPRWQTPCARMVQAQCCSSRRTAPSNCRSQRVHTPCWRASRRGKGRRGLCTCRRLSSALHCRGRSSARLAALRSVPWSSSATGRIRCCSWCPSSMTGRAWQRSREAAAGTRAGTTPEPRDCSTGCAGRSANRGAPPSVPTAPDLASLPIVPSSGTSLRARTQMTVTLHLPMIALPASSAFDLCSCPTPSPSARISSM